MASAIRPQRAYLLFFITAEMVLLLLLVTCSHKTDSSRSVNPATVRLHAESRAIIPGKPLRVAIEITLEQGWHTYWLNPGDAGLAPEFSWSLPDGWRHSAVALPLPERFESMGMVSFGYAHRPVFLATVIPPPHLSTDSAVISLGLKLLLCKEACVVYSDTVRLTLPAGEPSASERVDTATKLFFDKAAGSVPRSDTIISRWRYAEKNRIVVEIPMGSGGTVWSDGAFFPINPGIFDYSGRQDIKRVNNVVTVSLLLSTMQESEPERIRGLLVTKGRMNKDSLTAVFIRAEKN